MNALIAKYHVPAPRYTSYPTVPFWDTATPDVDQWKASVARSARENDGLSLYVHLPFCESLCTYCGCNTRITRNHDVEIPYLQAVLREWELYRPLFEQTPVVRELHLGGGTPTFFHPSHLATLIHGLLRHANVPSDAAFSFEAHPQNTTREHLSVLAGLNFKRISIGIQDFDPVVQLAINRVQTVEQVERLTADARSLGYQSVNYDLIYGLPMQSLHGLEATIRQALTFKPDRIAFYSYAHVPWLKPGQRKFTEDDLPSVEQKQALHELGRMLFKEAGYLEIGMDHFALPADSLSIAAANGTLHRNFMGYTDQYTQLLVGLGVSSISDSGTAFAQNEKKVEDYLAAIDQQRLALIKHHPLSSEDLLVRTHILNLMCRGNTSWDESDALQSRLMQDAIERLIPLEDDELVRIHHHALTVTPLGKRFLRNICMMLDERLWTQEQDGKKFSMAG